MTTRIPPGKEMPRECQIAKRARAPLRRQSAMESVISISEVVDKQPSSNGELEICATLESTYDKVGQQLTVRLGCHAQQAQDARRVSMAWLPAEETLREHVGREEASDVARDIFHRWAERVRHAVPQPAPA